MIEIFLKKKKKRKKPLEFVQYLSTPFVAHKDRTPHLHSGLHKNIASQKFNLILIRKDICYYSCGNSYKAAKSH